MHKDDPQYLSPEKYKELEAELLELKSVKRKEIAEALEFAKSLGDLSENAEYQEARENQAAIEDRISKLENIMKHAVMIAGDHHGGIVELGSHISVRKNGEKEIMKFAIVGSEEANVTQGKISNDSPLGKALIGKKKGDDVTVATPKGKLVYTVVGIE